MPAPIPKLATLGKNFLQEIEFYQHSIQQGQSEFRGQSCWKAVILMRTSPVVTLSPQKTLFPVESQNFLFPNQRPHPESAAFHLRSSSSSESVLWREGEDLVGRGR